MKIFVFLVFSIFSVIGIEILIYNFAGIIGNLFFHFLILFILYVLLRKSCYSAKTNIPEEIKIHVNI